MQHIYCSILIIKLHINNKICPHSVELLSFCRIAKAIHDSTPVQVSIMQTWLTHRDNSSWRSLLFAWMSAFILATASSQAVTYHEKIKQLYYTYYINIIKLQNQINRMLQRSLEWIKLLLIRELLNGSYLTCVTYLTRKKFLVLVS